MAILSDVAHLSDDGSCAGPAARGTLVTDCHTDDMLTIESGERRNDDACRSQGCTFDVSDSPEGHPRVAKLMVRTLKG